MTRQKTTAKKSGKKVIKKDRQVTYVPFYKKRLFLVGIAALLVFGLAYYVDNRSNFALKNELNKVVDELEARNIKNPRYVEYCADTQGVYQNTEACFQGIRIDSVPINKQEANELLRKTHDSMLASGAFTAVRPLPDTVDSSELSFGQAAYRYKDTARGCNVTYDFLYLREGEASSDPPIDIICAKE